MLEIRDTGTTPSEHVRQLLTTRLGDLDRQIRELQTLRTSVAQLLDAAASPEPGSCEAADVCRYL